MTPEQIIHTFYQAFQRRDYATMQKLYHEEAAFSDPVFPNLNAAEVRSMWQMLLTSPTDLRVEYSSVKGKLDKGSCHWEAWYHFSKTNRPVHNRIDSTFEFSSGKILQQRDHFSFWSWSRQALGLPGVFLGWSPIIKNKVQSMARARLDQFMLR